MKKNAFYGIGVGPGEGELITLKGKRILLESDIFILPAKDKDSCRAFQIASSQIPELQEKECLFYPFPMSMKEPALTEFHQKVAETIITQLKAEKQVSFLTIGDPCIYSTYAYIANLVEQKGYLTEYISGIPSFIAAAARLGIPLTLGNEQLHIIPGNMDPKEALQLSGTLVFMKSGKRLALLKEVLEEEEKKQSIYVGCVSNCGYENELVVHEASQIPVEAGYMTVVIVKRKMQ